jgi:hypothetical protein
MVTRQIRVPAILRRLTQYFLALVFVLSAIGKATSPAAFLNFRSLLPFLSSFDEDIALYGTLIWEFAVASLLLIKQTSATGSILAFASLLLFSAVLIYASSAGVTLPCGCFGRVYQERSLDFSILRNILLLTLAALSTAGLNRTTKPG